jgi:hypothetical protein
MTYFVKGHVGVLGLYNDSLRKHARIYNGYGIPREYLRGY